MTTMRSDECNEIATALAKAQGAMKNAEMNKTNPHYRSRYADLASVIDAVRTPLASNGIGYTQTMVLDPRSGLLLVTTLMHTSGQWIATEYPLPQNAKPQEFGSVLTYARRYSLSCITGNASDEDDDANAGNAAARKPIPVAVDTMRPIGEAAAKVVENLNPQRSYAPGVDPKDVEFDWITFGQKIISVVKANGEGELHDDPMFARMEAEAPKVYKRMMAAIEKLRPKPAQPSRLPHPKDDPELYLKWLKETVAEIQTAQGLATFRNDQKSALKDAFPSDATAAMEVINARMEALSAREAEAQ